MPDGGKEDLNELNKVIETKDEKIKTLNKIIEKKNKIIKDKKRKIYLEKYKLTARAAFYQDNNFWILFSIFGVMNGLILSNLIVNYSNVSKELKIGLSFFGIFLCGIWLLISGRSITYRDDRMKKAPKILDKIEIGDLEELELWPKKREELKNEGLSGGNSATLVSMFFIYMLLYIWFASLLIILYVEFLRNKTLCLNNYFGSDILVTIILILCFFIIVLIYYIDFSKREGYFNSR